MLNEYLIDKMGWNIFARGCLSHSLDIPFQDDRNVLFYFHLEDEKKIYVIKHTVDGEYKFVYCDYNIDYNNKYNFESFKFKNTYEFLVLVSKFQCCNLKYKRLFKISNILKK